MTGESLPVEAGSGSSVLAGYINGQGVLEVRTERDWRHSALARVEELVEAASGRKSPLEGRLSSFSRIYTPLVISIAALVFLLYPLVTGGSWADGLFRALVLLVISCPCALVLSIPLGLFTARHSGGALDKALTVVNQVLMAVPAFFTGILLTYLFGLLLRWFVPGSFVSPAENFWQSAGYLVFPAAAIAIPRIAMTVKMLRSALLAEMNKDYVRTSYSRGNDRRATLYLHVLRNALPPVVSFLAMTVADIVAGSVVIEQVFAIPGLGRLLLTSISNRDYPVVQAVVVLVAFWVVRVYLLGDLLNQRLDPRLRLTD